MRFGLQIRQKRSRVLDMAGDQFGHLEHVDLRFAAKDRLQLIVGHDFPLVAGILEIVFLDVIPELLGDFGSRYRLAANNCG